LSRVALRFNAEVGRIMANSISIRSNDPNAIYKEWLGQSDAIPPSKTKKILAKKLLIAVAIVGVIMGLCFILAGFFNDFAEDAAASRKEMSMQEKSSEDDPVTWLKDIEDYRKNGSNSILSLAAANKRQASKGNVEAKNVQPMEDLAEKRLSQQQVLRKPIAVAHHAKSEPRAPNPSDPWGQIYGAAPRSRNLASTYGAAASENTKGTADSAVGSRLPVKLKGTAASNPSGPVIAVLVKDMIIGGRDLARGTEIHGESHGAGQGARLTMSFTTIRPKNGSAIKFSGRAMSTDGRMGVVGIQSMGRGSDIAASTLGSAVRSTGNLVSAFVGSNPLGAAIDGAVSPIAEKAQRIDYEENAVVLGNGSRFDIHIDEI
jgi:hypothetical protein